MAVFGVVALHEVVEVRPRDRDGVPEPGEELPALPRVAVTGSY
jgi:hypothetical protein